MASLARTTMLRHASLHVPSMRLLSSGATLSTAIGTSSFVRSSSSILLRQATRSNTIFRTASFHSSAQRSILPPGPQVIEGGVNEAAPVPKPSPTHGSYHWTFERLLSVALVPLTITPFAAGSISPAIDAALVFTILVHSHIGFQSCITDYFSTLKHPTLRKFFDWLLNIMTIVVAVGFYEFETNDVGLTEAIKRIWHAGQNDATVGAADVSSLGHDGKLKHLKN